MFQQNPYPVIKSFQEFCRTRTREWKMSRKASYIHFFIHLTNQIDLFIPQIDRDDWWGKNRKEYFALGIWPHTSTKSNFSLLTFTSVPIRENEQPAISASCVVRRLKSPRHWHNDEGQPAAIHRHQGRSRRCWVSVHRSWRSWQAMR